MNQSQNPDLLGMAGRGSRGNQDRADGSILEEGVHLRWQMAPELGFPPGGFDVYRRGENYWRYFRCGSFSGGNNEPINWVPYGDDVISRDVKITSSGDAEITTGCAPVEVLAASFPGVQEVKIEFSEHVRFVGLQFDAATRGNPVGEAWWRSEQGDVLLSTKRARRLGPLRLLSLFGNHIDYVILRGEDMVICRLCVVLVRDGADEGWPDVPLNGKTPIHLPVTHPEWPGVHAHSPDDQLAAETRLPANLPAEKRESYLDGFQDELHGLLYDLAGTAPQYLSTVTEQDDTSDAQLAWPTMNLMHLLGIDPNIARILGLYWHDEPPSAFRFYDYRVVAHYGDNPLPGVSVDFKGLTPGDRLGVSYRQSKLEFLSPNPIDVVQADWKGTEMNALLFTRTIATGPITILLPKDVRSITLRLTAAALFVIKVNQKGGTLFQETRLGGNHLLTFEDKYGLDTIIFFPIGEITLFEIILRRKIGKIGDLTYDVYHLRSRAQSAVSTPDLDPPEVAATSSGLDETGALMRNRSGVALRWERREAGGVYLEPGAPLLYHVRRDDFAPEGSSVLASAILNESRPTLISRRGGEDGELDTGEGPHFADRNVADGRYAYAVRGIDLFGVLGDWSDPEDVEVLSRFAPPPPQSVAATYLNPSDPGLDAGDAAWTAANGSGLKISWVWPGLFGMQAPDVGPPLAEFRIYSADGPTNVFAGNVTQVTVTGAESQLQTDARWDGGRDALAGESVRIGDAFYRVSGNSRGRNMTLAIENLSSPDRIPETGPFSLTFSPDRAYRRDYGEATAWDERLHIEPAAALPIVLTTVTAVDVYAAETVESDAGTTLSREGAAHTVTLADEPVQPVQHSLVPGVLFCEGIVYPAYAHTTGVGFQVHIPSTTSPDDIGQTILPPIGASCEYYPGVKYELRVPGYSLAIADGDRTAMAQVAVSCSDGVAHTSDDPVWSQPGKGGLGGRPGNESVLSSQATINTTLYDSPQPLAMVPAAGDDPIFAQPANYYGIAKYGLSWDPVSGVAGYTVYRASGAGLFDQDRQLRQEQKGAYASGSIFADDPEFANWLGTYDPALTESEMLADVDGNLGAWRAWASRFYAQLTDAEVQRIAGLDGNERAFRMIHTEPLTTTEIEDRFDGRGRGFYVYRVRTIDAAGNESAWAGTLSFPPVHIFDVTPPEVPKIISAIAIERGVVLTWRSNRESDLLEYRVWRARTAEELVDVRRTTPAHVVSPGPDQTQVLQDTGLDGRADYHYRVAAVDERGNQSKPTPVFSVRTLDMVPPEPPEWLLAEWVSDIRGDAARLHWHAHEDDVTCLLQRRPLGGGVWLGVSDWLAASLPPFEFEFLDRTADPEADYEYRILARDAAGNESTALTIQPLRSSAEEANNA